MADTTSSAKRPPTVGELALNQSKHRRNRSAPDTLLDLILSKPRLSVLSQKPKPAALTSIERDGQIADARSRNVKFPPAPEGVSFGSRIATASVAPVEPLLGDRTMDGDLTWRELLPEHLKQHTQKARDQGNWLHRRDQNIGVSPADLEAQIADGKFIWGVDRWVIADPMANIDYLRATGQRSSTGTRPLQAAVCAELTAMARVNLERRAEIGLAKRNRTRAAILEAARRCYAAPTPAPVTVDAVMQVAGLAKGTFYVHLEELAALEAELGETLTEELDQRLQPARLAADHPLTRLATAVTVLLRDLAATPARARLVARAAATIPDVVNAMQAHLREDLADAHAAGLLAVASIEVAARIVTAISRLAAQDLAESRIDDAAIPDIVRATLRAIGCTPREAMRHAEAAEGHARTIHADGSARRSAFRRRNP
jgi:AcrR family transcriptional regulator